MICSSLRPLAAVAALALTPACSFYSTAVHWNGRVGSDGEPVHVVTSTNLGVNLGIVVPLFGRTSIDEMVEEITAEIARRGGDHVRVFETKSENYWHGFPPFTWFATPVITDVSVEYRPSEEELAQVRSADEAARGFGEDGRERDTSDVAPDDKNKQPDGAPVSDPERIRRKIDGKSPEERPDGRQ